MKKFLYSLVLIFAVSSSYALNTHVGVMLFRMKNVFLVQAAAQGNESVVLTLLSLPGTDPSTQDASGRTALHYATEKGLLALSQALLMSGTDPTIKDSAGETARSLAIKAGQHEIELLFGT